MGNIKFNIGQVLLVIYCIIAFSLSIVQPTLFENILKPILLSAIAVILFVVSENHHGRFPRLKENIKTIIILTLFYIIIYYLSGLIFGFSHNIYSIKKLPINLFRLVLPIIAIEYSRSALVNDNKQSIVMIIIYTLLFIIVETNISGLINVIGDYEATFKYVSSYIVPTIFYGISFTYLVLKGSYKLTLPFRVLTQVCILVTPVLPSHDWFATGIFGVLTPVIMFVIFRYDLNKKDDSRLSRRKREKNPIVYFPMFAILIVFILFMAGVFKYEPIAILSNSMVPVFHRGDVVIYSKPTEEELKKIEKDTIIVYSKDKQSIVHRVKEVYKEEGHTYFITKGDANVTDDASPVKDEQLIGIYVTHVKFAGYPSVWLNQIFKHEKPTVEIK